jgi:hypothetical protein
MSKEANRIWRTVVFSGAMLGAPLVSADTKAPPQQAPNAPAKPIKPAPPTPLQVAQSELDAATKKVADATAAVSKAQNQADRDFAKAQLAAAQRDKATAEKKVADLKNPPDPKLATLRKLETDLADLDARVSKAVDAVVAAQNDADRQSAKAKLESLRKEKAGLDAKIAAEKDKLAKAAKPQPRPRTDDSDKPVGRGFILS